MPSRVMASASSITFTPSHSACSAAIGATVSSPWSYAFALTTTITAVPGTVTLRSASILARSFAASISIHDSITFIIWWYTPRDDEHRRVPRRGLRDQRPRARCERLLQNRTRRNRRTAWQERLGQDNNAKTDQSP